MIGSEIKVQSPIKIDSTPRVAYELMRTIDDHNEESVKKDKTYWLTLYRQCYKAANGDLLKYILQED